MAEVVGPDALAVARVQDLPVLITADLDADPHGMFRKYRATHPFVRREMGGYLVLRHADVERLGSDPRTASSETAFPKMLGVTDGALFDFFEQGMLTANGAAHRRRRSPFSRSFAARTIAALRPKIRRAAEELIDGWYADGQVEFVGQFASPLPARVIGDLLGLPRADIPSFTELVYDMTRFVSHSVRPDEIPGSQSAAGQLRHYVETALDDGRRTPRDDFLSDFLAMADTAGELSPLEIVMQIVQLIVGGTDTTRIAIVMQVALLLQHREQWDALCRDPSLIPGAVAEALRFEPSVASFVRVTTEDIELGGAVLPARQLIVLSTMSAARDEHVYERRDTFDIHRTDQPRLLPAFGAGAHRCLGEALARAELEESLAALASRNSSWTRLPQFMGTPDSVASIPCKYRGGHEAAGQASVIAMAAPGMHGKHSAFARSRQATALIDRMGHAIPTPMWSLVVDAIATHAHGATKPNRFETE